MVRKNNQIKKIQNLDLKVDEIEKLLDSASVTDEIVDFIAKKYEKQIEEDESFQRIKDIIELVDLTKNDESAIDVIMSEAAKRSFFSLASKGKLSRPEIIYFVKKKFVNDDDLKKLFESKSATSDLIEVLLRWQPQIFENTLKSYCDQYKISNKIIEQSKQRILQLEKFNFLLS
jgi:transcription termination factor NusB